MQDATTFQDLSGLRQFDMTKIFHLQQKIGVRPRFDLKMA
jgi:hypothetical protein